MRFSRKLFRRSFFDRMMNTFRLKKHTPLRVKLLTTFAIISLLISGLTFAVGGVGAAITWPSAPAGEASGGTIMSYLQNAFGDFSAGKSCTGSGVITGFDGDGTPRCTSISELSGGASASTTPPTTTTTALPPTATSISSTGITTTSGTNPTIASGASTTIIWNIPNATVLNASSNPTTSDWSGTKSNSGSQVVTPTTTTTYTVTYTGSDGSTLLSSGMTITVNQLPTPELKVNAGTTVDTTTAGSSVSIPYDGSVTLSWSQNNATSCSVKDDATANNLTVSSNSVTINNLTTNKTYTITCNSPGGTISEQVTVNVANQASPSVILSASSVLIKNGEKVTLSWNASNATSCTASGDWNGDKSASGGTAEVIPKGGTTTYSIKCFGQGDYYDQKSINITSSIKPQVTFLAIGSRGNNYQFSNSSHIVYESYSYMLSWNASNATSCTASGDWYGDKGTIGTEYVTPQIGEIPSNYILNCSGIGGGSTQVRVILLGESKCYTRLTPPNQNSYSILTTYLWGEDGCFTNDVIHLDIPSWVSGKKLEIYGDIEKSSLPYSLRSLRIGNGITHIPAHYAFNLPLESIELPPSIEFMGEFAFYANSPKGTGVIYGPSDGYVMESYTTKNKSGFYNRPIFSKDKYPTYISQ